MRILTKPLCVAIVFSGCVLGQQTPTPAPAPQAQNELVIEQIRKTVVFISGQYPDSQGRPVSSSGTGFLIAASEPRTGKDSVVNWLVTNKHVLRKLNPDGSLGDYLPFVIARVNLRTPQPDGSLSQQVIIPVSD